eukprot:1130737-Pyramimonas_sp.AAC.1
MAASLAALVASTALTPSSTISCAVLFSETCGGRAWLLAAYRGAGASGLPRQRDRAGPRRTRCRGH